MFLDFRKNLYKDKDEVERKKLIERDKKIQQSIITEYINEEKAKIANRIYSIDDIGIIDCSESITALITEAENLYAYGFFSGCISVIGIAAEEFSVALVLEHSISKNITKDQSTRLKKLLIEKIINDNLYSKLDFIRMKRNDCVHYKKTFKESSDAEKELIALDCINNFKQVLKSLKGIKSIELADMPKEAVKSSKTFMETALKTRNMMSQIFETDVMITDEKFRIIKNYYFILELDLSEYKEITFCDFQSKIPVIVDLTEAQCRMIERRKIEEGNIVLAAVISAIDNMGMTAQWILLEIFETDHLKYNFDL